MYPSAPKMDQESDSENEDFIEGFLDHSNENNSLNSRTSNA